MNSNSNSNAEFIVGIPNQNSEFPFVANLLRFAELLRRGGLDIHGGRMPDAIAALERVGVRRRDDVQAALRCLLIHRREDIPFFDEAFDRFWRARGAGGGGLPLLSLGERPRIRAEPKSSTPVEFDSEVADAGGSHAKPLAAGAWSATESLRARDFAELTPAELLRAEALLARVPWRLGVRRTRREVQAPWGRVDLRRIVRRNMKHGGELVVVPRRARREKPRPIVVLADVSGSMERYSRLLLQFVYGMASGAHAVESFVFATRLTRITREVAHRGSGAALAVLAGHVRDWGGGTRIGDALRVFNLHYARRVMRHGPVVLVISDGWDRGDPEQLARELARVRRSCRRLVWLNPLLGSRSYEPLTRGMRAALPFVDDFLPAHNLVSLEQLASHLRSLDRHAD
jgi:uncharacterized protein with von Willebrand factor type A (vWA) domain